MTQKPRNALLVAQRRQRIANLYLQGWSQASIAEELQITQTTVSRDLKRIQAEWRASAIRDFDTQCGIELQKLDRLEREAWAAWERSQKPSQQARMRGSTSEQNAERVVKNQVGDPRFLEQVHKCIAARRALLGLDAPTRIEGVGLLVKPMTIEERRKHIEAIVREFQQPRITEGQSNDTITIEASPVEANGRGTLEAEPPGTEIENGP